ncbi:hypothetical protein PRZ48_002602 [Zasmidium cellare]|uniref:Uncharacterized protein n=1 Tax=Zasmidium cellare TaxID=395010 RepID=A0ABR0ETX5_ZASCE|nr:hypothetical protein PRZ48_002602 [Zasmidium cellare]
MLSRSSSRRHHHHHHHHDRSPPREYRDLSKSDIELLAPILDALPEPDASNASTYRRATKKMITDLPSHLRAKIPQVSSFCSLHHHLNPLPIIDLLKAIQHELTPSSLRTWKDVDDLPFTTLQDINFIWTKADDFSKLFGRAPSIRFSYEGHKCAACKLACLARNVEAMIAVGAIMIARLDPKNWRKSKRILWFEVWLKGCIQWRQDDDCAVDVMWKTGVILSKGMSKKGDAERPWMEKAIAEAKASNAAPPRDPSPSRSTHANVPAAVRPIRSPGQDDHVAFVAEALQDPFMDPAPDPPTTPTATPVNPFDDPENDQAVGSLFPDRSSTHRSAIPEPLRTSSRCTTASDERARLVRTPATTDTDFRVASSSIYSRRPDEDGRSARFSRSDVPSEVTKV